MSLLNKILTKANAVLKITNLYGDKPVNTLDGLPLGTIGDSATEELAVKVLQVGNRGPSTTQYNGVFGTAGPLSAATVFNPIAIGNKGVIQNLSAGPLFVKLGAGGTTSSYNFILPGCTVQDDGTSPPVVIDDYIGVVTAASATTVRYAAYLLFPA